MENNQETSNERPLDIFASWEVPEYNSHDRDFRWYLITGIFALFLLIYSFISGNFLLPIILIITAFIFIMQHGSEADKVSIALASDCLVIGKRAYDYDEFRNFSIVYKPSQGDKNLYFEFKNPVKQRISIPLENINPVDIRNFLLAFLSEDLDRTNIPLSESLAKLFKL
ncbi:hypothetical protein C0583_03525 [Candidatus Parcubacteria bacterium]|nr:MAG: hypothetical protein C0583_03525 [Candidatus Parcubacteria bacterium]